MKEIPCPAPSKKLRTLPRMHTLSSVQILANIKIDSVEEDHFLVSGSGRFEEVTEIKYTEVVDADKFYELQEMV